MFVRFWILTVVHVIFSLAFYFSSRFLNIITLLMLCMLMVIWGWVWIYLVFFFMKTLGIDMFNDHLIWQRMVGMRIWICSVAWLSIEGRYRIFNWQTLWCWRTISFLKCIPILMCFYRCVGSDFTFCLKYKLIQLAWVIPRVNKQLYIYLTCMSDPGNVDWGLK